MSPVPVVLREAAEFAALAALFYVVLRWVTASLLVHLAAGVEYGLNLVAVGLLLPEYLCTRVRRRASGRAAPFAHAYGDAVCALVCGGHRCAGAVLTALHQAACRLGHRESLYIGLAGATLVAGPWWIWV